MAGGNKGNDLVAMRVSGWIERTRSPTGGFGGPVAHWWRDSLLDCRPGYDWRHEGIVAGYLALHRRTSDERWLALARLAGDDLVRAQLADGHWPRSRFELNPGTAGTPHESACAVALLTLAEHLTDANADVASAYLTAARRSIEALIARFWRRDRRELWDDARSAGFVPNKAATFIDALVRMARVTGDAAWIDEYALPVGGAILAHQLHRQRDALDGAIAQNRLGGRVIEKYFPYYVARCIPPLLALGDATGQSRFVGAALAAGRFVASTIDPRDGSLPQIVYPTGRVNRDPRWIAATGDVLRALAACVERGLDCDRRQTEAWLLAGLNPDGSVRTAVGFAGQSGRAAGPIPEFRDLLPVVGWVDKAFRYFAEAGTRGPEPTATEWSIDCVYHGRLYLYEATASGIAARARDRVAWSWRHGDNWAAVADPVFATK